MPNSLTFTLRPKDIKKASELFGIDEAILTRLNSQRLLNTDYIRCLIIRTDYERLTSGLHWLEYNNKEYKFPEVMRALQQEYNISPKKLNQILHERVNESIHFCKKCGVRISRRTSDRTEGLCSTCFAETLEL